MKVRGAPAIAICGLLAVATWAHNERESLSLILSSLSLIALREDHLGVWRDGHSPPPSDQTAG